MKKLRDYIKENHIFFINSGYITKWTYREKIYSPIAYVRFMLSMINYYFLHKN